MGKSVCPGSLTAWVGVSELTVEEEKQLPKLALWLHTYPVVQYTCTHTKHTLTILFFKNINAYVCVLLCNTFICLLFNEYNWYFQEMLFWAFYAPSSLFTLWICQRYLWKTKQSSFLLVIASIYVVCFFWLSICSLIKFHLVCVWDRVIF